MEFNITMNSVLSVISITSVWCGVLFVAAHLGAKSGRKKSEKLAEQAAQSSPATGL